MPSTNGHKKTAILYTRVSGDKQRDHGYSLSDQRRELGAWAAREGYHVLDVVEDAAWSGGDLARPGLDDLRNRVALGGVDAVVVLFRDRLARGVYAGLLAEEFAEHGCRLVALNAHVDDSPEGELHGGMLDIIAAWERKKIAERTRRGKLEKARQGKIIATMKPRYGFRYNEAKDGLVVYEPEMAVVEKIFRLAAEGFGPRAIQLRLYRQSIPSPKGGKRWNRPVIKRMVLHDIYKPHTYEETVKLVSPEVAATLDPSKEYGIRWWNCLSKDPPSCGAGRQRPSAVSQTGHCHPERQGGMDSGSSPVLPAPPAGRASARLDSGAPSPREKALGTELGAARPDSL